jgi:Na+-driven multidrug efflux pump
MVIASGANDSDRARRAFQASVNIAIYVVLPLIVTLVFSLSLLPVSRDLRLTQLQSRAVFEIVACSGAVLWFQTLKGLMVAALYAAGSYGLAYYIQGISKVFELLGIAVVVALFNGSQVAAALVIAIAALAELLIVAFFARRAAQWARIDLRVLDWSWLSSQGRPAIGFMVSNFATQGLMAQGARVALGALLGGAAVAVYAIYGTAMRFVDQLLLMLVFPLEIEIAHSAGQSDLNRIERLIIIGTHISWILYILVSASLLLLGPLIFRIWTTGHIAFSYTLMALYMIMSACNLQGRVSLHALISTNRMFESSFMMLGAATFAVILGAALSPLFGIQGMVLGGIIGEIANSAIAISAVATWLGKPLRTFIADFLDFKGTTSELVSRMRGAPRSITSD